MSRNLDFNLNLELHLLIYWKLDGRRVFDENDD